jgi:AraC-like DNA-binding protein
MSHLPRASQRDRSSAPADGFAPVHFSTWSLPERERLGRWREEFGRRIIGVEIEPDTANVPFHAEATLQALPDCRIASCVGSAGRLNRTSALVGDGDDSIGLVVNLGPTIVMSQRGREATLQLGEATLLMHQEPAVLTHGNLRFYGLVFPRGALAERIRDLDGAMMTPIPRARGTLNLLVRYLELIQTETDLSVPGLARSVARHIHDLTALAFGTTRSTCEPPLSAVAAARLAAVVAQIEGNFADLGFNAETVARSQGISLRYLRALLEASGQSFTSRVHELRLQKAFDLLSGGGKRRVADVAMDVGFSDVSHFNRLFRARFGDTPSGVRGLIAEGHSRPRRTVPYVR